MSTSAPYPAHRPTPPDVALGARGQTDPGQAPVAGRWPAVAVLASTDLLAEALAALLVRHDVNATAMDSWGLGRAPSPDVLVLVADADLVDAQVLELKERAGGARVVLVVAEADMAAVGWAQRLAVDGLVDGQTGGAELSHVVLRVAHGRRVFPATVVVDRPAARLSARQRDVLALVADGRSNGEIARELTITVNTVKFHVRTIFRELGIHNRVEASRVWADMQGRAHPIW
jgi:DNA-binding NarL/FixJ family response regulator